MFVYLIIYIYIYYTMHTIITIILPYYRSTSPPGGNQVDGLPAALHLRFRFKLSVLGFKFIFFMLYVSIQIFCCCF